MSINLFVGAKQTGWPGWISTDLNFGDLRLDIRNRADWLRQFAPSSIDKIVCEHCLEHLSLEEANAALQNFHEFLKPGGQVRLAVPDAFNPNWWYQENCRPKGPGQVIGNFFLFAPGEAPHKVHWNIDTLSDAMRAAGLSPKPLEWFDAIGAFHRSPFANDAGPISRRVGSFYNLLFEMFFGFPSLSLIVDGVK